MNKKVVFYCFRDSKESEGQKSNVINCDLEQAHKLFDEEYAKKKNGTCEWDHFDITVNGRVLRSSNE
ncbi:hypothetical protein [Geosporobacter ferrireducens]|uniref:hypothetical protein n=1 Tax=Geosporobacter ferrireducens TaxID=1424294 RepID=UPI00139D4CED|nr:hypothetical protein [Geosporobacter ferrireducens]MTI53791.1 hypothetical protein [Geosporobacter ferrireducens]